LQLTGIWRLPATSASGKKPSQQILESAKIGTGPREGGLKCYSLKSGLYIDLGAGPGLNR